MADSTTPLDSIATSQGSKEVTANALLDAASPAMLFGRRAPTTLALTFGYYGGRINGTAVADGTVALTASNTNYVVAHRTTYAVTSATTLTNWNDTATYGRMYKLVTGAATVTSHEDHRFGMTGILGGSSTGTSGTVTSVDADNGVETVSGSPITSTGSLRAKKTVNALTGTTDTIVTADRGKLVTYTNAAAIAVTLPQAGASFPSGWFYDTQNRGAGTVTITPTTSTIDGAASLTLKTDDGVTIVSDGNNYFTRRGRLRTIASADLPAQKTVIQMACSDETTPLTAGAGKVTFRMPYAMTVTDVRASLTTASSSGLVTVDINEGGTSIISTKLTIDATEKTSTTAATPYVLSDTSLADDAEITIDIDGAGTNAAGLKVAIIGTRVA
jgi:hypothetical protein